MRAATQEKLALALSCGKPKSSKELMVELRLNSDIVESALGRMWRSFRVLRVLTWWFVQTSPLGVGWAWLLMYVNIILICWVLR